MKVLLSTSHFFNLLLIISQKVFKVLQKQKWFKSINETYISIFL